MALRLLDTFAGIGGFSYAAERLVGGFETVAFVEREPFCQQVLAKHWPDVPIHDDIQSFQPTPGMADVITGGFPCQDISKAGKIAGIAPGTRSGLFFDLMRVIRVVQPRFVVLENVAAIRKSQLGTVLGELAAAGFDVEWACFPASDLGACHRRDRWWAVAYPNQDECPAGREQLQQQGRAAAARRRAPAADPDQEHSQGCGAEGQQIEPAPGEAGRTVWSDQRAVRLNPDWGAYESEPLLCRGNDGLSGRVDRLKALGNAIVPHAAQPALLRVAELNQKLFEFAH